MGMHALFRLMLAGLVVASAPTVFARAWTNADGRVIEADYVSSDATSVTLKLQGKEVRYPLDKLSVADREFVAGQAKAAAAPKLPAGLSKNQPMTAGLFSDSKEHMKERDRKKLFEAYAKYKDQAGANKGTPDDWVARDPAKDSFNIYIPKSYDGTQPYGLVVQSSPGDNGDIPAMWYPLFDELKLIVVTPNGAGNYQPMLRRATLAMDAMAMAERLCKIDPSRRVTNGLSGGGHMAMLTAAMYPTYFKGAVSHAAQSYLPDNNGYGGHFLGLDLNDFTRGDRSKIKWRVISGNKDQNYQEILKTTEAWKKAKTLDYSFIDVPGMGHNHSQPDPLREAFKQIGL